MKNEETAKMFLKRLRYSREEGLIYWKTINSQERYARRFNKIHAEKIAGDRTNSTYLTINCTLNKKVIPAKVHQVIWLFEYGVWPTEDIDHIDGNKLNNCYTNLREVPRKINCQNRTMSKNNSTGTSGVQFNRKKYKGMFLDYWVARWYDGDGVQKVKHFRISVLGDENAFNLACEHRKKMLDLLNEQGAGYTDRHGT